MGESCDIRMVAIRAGRWRCTGGAPVVHLLLFLLTVVTDPESRCA